MGGGALCAAWACGARGLAKERARAGRTGGRRVRWKGWKGGEGERAPRLHQEEVEELDQQLLARGQRVLVHKVVRDGDLLIN